MKAQHPEVSVRGIPAEIAAQVEAQIRSRLGGQVSDLRAVVRGDGLALQGRSCTHHRRFPRRKNSPQIDGSHWYGYEYSNVTGRLCNQGTGWLSVLVVASRRMGLWHRRSRRTMIRWAWISTTPPVSTNVR